MKKLDSLIINESKLTSMKRTVLIFGLIIGVILAMNMVAMVQMIYRGDGFKGNDLVGYAALVLIFSLIFFGVRNYRKNQTDGLLTFGKAFSVGALIAFIASTIYVLVWFFYYYLFVPDFMEVYTSCVLRQCSAAELPAKTLEMANFAEMYKNPVFVILITYSEVLPIGLVVSLVTGLILKKRIKTNSIED